MCLGVPTKDKELTNLKVIIKDECFGEFYVYDLEFDEVDAFAEALAPEGRSSAAE